MLMQNFGVTNKDHYGMLWYFWSGLLQSKRYSKRSVPWHSTPEHESPVWRLFSTIWGAKFHKIGIFFILLLNDSPLVSSPFMTTA